MKALFRFGAAAVLLAAQAAGGAQVQAQSLEEFFKAQPLTILVGYPPGAAYDTYARLIARRSEGHPGADLTAAPRIPERRLVRRTPWSRR